MIDEYTHVTALYLYQFPAFLCVCSPCGRKEIYLSYRYRCKLLDLRRHVDLLFRIGVKEWAASCSNPEEGEILALRLNAPWYEPMSLQNELQRSAARINANLERAGILLLECHEG